MIRYFCDICKKEFELTQMTIYSHLVHIEQNATGRIRIGNDITPCSTKKEEYEVCFICYNRIMKKAYDEFKKIEEENKNKDDKGEFL